VNKILSVLVALAIGLSAAQAQAKRMGGGKSMGQQSSQVSKREAAPAQPAAPAQQAAPSAANKPASPAAQAPAKKPWGAMLGGLAAGLGLAWLASSLGLGEAFGQFMLIALLALVAMVVIGMIMRSRANKAAHGGPGGPGGLAYQGAGHSPQSPAQPTAYSPDKVGNDASARPWETQPSRFDGGNASTTGGASIIGSGLMGSQAWGVPAGFDAQGFVEAAKRNFVSLQDAWDRSDIASLRAMMTDAMLQEIQAQLTERETHRSGAVNKTEVLKLDAALLGIEELPEVYMASVEFNGVIREEADAAPTSFREVWNMTKPRHGGGGWLVAGVQALQ
jgi:predicted lipid-binding transport protein (Tim44 family)